MFKVFIFLEELECVKRLPSHADQRNISDANSFWGDFIARTFFCLGQASDYENWHFLFFATRLNPLAFNQRKCAKKHGIIINVVTTQLNPLGLVWYPLNLLKVLASLGSPSGLITSGYLTRIASKSRVTFGVQFKTFWKLCCDDIKPLKSWWYARYCCQNSKELWCPVYRRKT